MTATVPASSNPPLIGALFDGPLDIVGDIHGEIDALDDLLRHLGYDITGVHPEHRRLVFIGDLVDRGPDSPQVVERVSTLVARGLAQCLLGNHELNLLRATRKEGNGWYFPDNHDHRQGKFLTAQTLAVEQRPTVQSFLSTLPLALERGDLRLAHAAWHGPSIETIRSSSASVIGLYDAFQQIAARLSHDTGLADLAQAQLAAHEAAMKNPDASMPLLSAVAAENALYQVANPVCIVTSGLERIAQQPFFASGKWRMVDRVRWWDDYEESTPVIIGHYWRWPNRMAQAAYSRGEPDLFSDLEAHHWFGAQNNVFCVDFSVGARFKEREAKPDAPFQCRLAAVRWPEQVLVFDNGQRIQLTRNFY